MLDSHATGYTLNCVVHKEDIFVELHRDRLKEDKEEGVIVWWNTHTTTPIFPHWFLIPYMLQGFPFPP